MSTDERFGEWWEVQEGGGWANDPAGEAGAFAAWNARQDEIDRLEREVAGLRKFVRRYGGPHLRECNLNMLRNPLTCTCRRDEQARALGITETLR